MDSEIKPTITATYLKEHGTILKTEGTIMILLGVAAILLPTLFTFAIELLIGALLLIGGIITMVRGCKIPGVSGSFTAVILGILTALAGLVLLMYPAEGVVSLTIILAILFLVQGIGEIATAFQSRNWPAWGWLLVSGIAAIFVAVLLLLALPSSADWAIGLLVGINLLFSGVSLLVLSSNVKNIGSEKEALDVGS